MIMMRWLNGDYERLYHITSVTGQDWDLASLGCSDEVKETIFRNMGTCGAGDIGILHGIGFEIFTPYNYNKVVSVPCICVLDDGARRVPHKVSNGVSKNNISVFLGSDKTCQAATVRMFLPCLLESATFV